MRQEDTSISFPTFHHFHNTLILTNHQSYTNVCYTISEKVNRKNMSQTVNESFLIVHSIVTAQVQEDFGFGNGVKTVCDPDCRSFLKFFTSY